MNRQHPNSLNPNFEWPRLTIRLKVVACFLAGSSGLTNLRITLQLMSTIFTKILNREIPAEFVYEDEHVFAIRDISPQAPVHIIIITKSEISGLAGLPDVGDHIAILNAAKVIGEQQNLNDGYRLVINQGNDGGQTVNHLHAHLLGGRKMGWPPG